MYLRRNRRRKAGEDYDYWTLVQLSSPDEKLTQINGC